MVERLKNRHEYLINSAEMIDIYKCDVDNQENDYVLFEFSLTFNIGFHHGVCNLLSTISKESPGLPFGFQRLRENPKLPEDRQEGANDLSIGCRVHGLGVGLHCHGLPRYRKST